MKTIFISTCKPRDGYGFSWVFNTDKSTTIVISSKFEAPTYIDKYVDGKVIDSICLDIFEDFTYSSSFNGYGIINSPLFFGLVFKTDKILIWKNSNLKNYSIINVSNSLTININKYHKVSFSSYHKESDSFIVALEDLYYKGFAPRYISKLTFSEKTFFRNPSAKFEKQLFELPKDKFPKVRLNDNWPQHDWLNIRAIFSDDNFFYVYTTGGHGTRTKSGSAWDYSIISKFDLKRNWICNFDINKGQGNPSSDNKYFILWSQEKKNKIYFYNTIDFTKEFELSLTAKQNLGVQKRSGSLKFDLIGDNFIIYGSAYLNFCKLKN